MPRTPESFVRARRESWARLHSLVDKAQNLRLAALSDDELQELGTLYRRASADLARAQTRYSTTTAGLELVRSLNALVLRAHSQIYSAPPPTPSHGFWFFFYGFPEAFRRHWNLIALAAFLMFAPAVASYIAVWTNDDNARLLVPDGVVQEVQKRAQTKQITGWGGNTHFEGLVSSPATSSTIMTNNIKVTILAVGLGVTAGLGTAIVLIQNGILLGALAGVATNASVDYLFWAVILPHGILELSAIAIAGGAGLLLARAIYAPGDLPRRDALKLAGGEAGKLLAGVALMLICAGLIEGFFTPTPLPPFAKITFAAFTGLILVVYLSLKPRSNAVKSSNLSRSA